MITKLFEVRDRATFIPVVATLMRSNDLKEKYLLEKAGYFTRLGNSGLILICALPLLETHYSPRDWKSPRTMPVAHCYIQDNFDKLVNGDVIDVEFILGETDKPAIPASEEEEKLFKELGW